MHVVHLIHVVREIIKSLQYIYISYIKILFKVKTIPTQYYCTGTIKTYVILKYDVCLIDYAIAIEETSSPNPF